MTFAKLNCHPKLQNADYDKIATVLAPAVTCVSCIEHQGCASATSQMTNGSG